MALSLIRKFFVLILLAFSIDIYASFSDREAVEQILSELAIYQQNIEDIKGANKGEMSDYELSWLIKGQVLKDEAEKVETIVQSISSLSERVLEEVSTEQVRSELSNAIKYFHLEYKEDNRRRLELSDAFMTEDLKQIGQALSVKYNSPFYLTKGYIYVIRAKKALGLSVNEKKVETLKKLLAVYSNGDEAEHD